MDGCDDITRYSVSTRKPRSAQHPGQLVDVQILRLHGRQSYPTPYGDRRVRVIVRKRFCAAQDLFLQDSCSPITLVVSLRGAGCCAPVRRRAPVITPPTQSRWGESGSSFDERITVNTGTAPGLSAVVCPARWTGLGPASTERSGAGRSRRSTPSRGELPVHGEGWQPRSAQRRVH